MNATSLLTTHEIKWGKFSGSSCRAKMCAASPGIPTQHLGPPSAPFPPRLLGQRELLLPQFLIFRIPRSRSNNIRRNILLAFLKCPIKIADTFRPYFFGIPYKSRAVIPHAIAASSWLFLQPLLKAPALESYSPVGPRMFLTFKGISRQRARSGNGSHLTLAVWQ